MAIPARAIANRRNPLVDNRFDVRNRFRITGVGIHFIILYELPSARGVPRVSIRLCPKGLPFIVNLNTHVKRMNTVSRVVAISRSHNAGCHRTTIIDKPGLRMVLLAQVSRNFDPARGTTATTRFTRAKLPDMRVLAGRFCPLNVGVVGFAFRGEIQALMVDQRDLVEVLVGIDGQQIDQRVVVIAAARILTADGVEITVALGRHIRTIAVDVQRIVAAQRTADCTAGNPSIAVVGPHQFELMIGIRASTYFLVDADVLIRRNSAGAFPV